MKKGISLIELMVVVSIILIAAAVVFPLIASAKGKAKEKVCIAQLRQMGVALMTYQEQNNQVFPSNKTFGSLKPFLGSLEVARCSLDEYAKGANSNATVFVGMKVSYYIVGMLEMNIVQSMQSLDVNHGIALCYVHRTKTPHFYTGSPNVLMDYQGPILLARRDGSVSRHLPAEHCFDQGTRTFARGSTLWDYFTSASIPSEHSIELTGGMPIVACP